MARLNKEETPQQGNRSFRDRVRAHAKERATFGKSSSVNIPEGMSFFQPKEEENALDFVPYEVTMQGLSHAQPGDLWYQKSFFVHRDVGAERKTHICPSTVGRRCPICEEYNIKRQEPSTPENDKIVQALKPKARQLFNVIDLDDEKKGVQLWDVPDFFFGTRLTKDLDRTEIKHPEYADFANLQSGMTLIVTMEKAQFKADAKRGGSGGKVNYTASRIDFEKRKPYNDDILKEAADLDQVLIIPSYDELQRKFLGVEEEEEAAPTHEPERGSRSHREPEPEEDPSRRSRRQAPEPEPATRSRRSREPEPEPESAPNQCPSPKGTFGVDIDRMSECNRCPIWGECREEADRLEKEAEETKDTASPPTRGRGR